MGYNFRLNDDSRELLAKLIEQGEQSLLRKASAYPDDVRACILAAGLVKALRDKGEYIVITDRGRD